MAGFNEGAVADVARLRQDFSRFQGANLEKSKYYDGKQKLKDLGISLPPQMRFIDTVLGWPGTVVDALEERLDFEGWDSPELDVVFRANDLDVTAPTAHLDALIFGTSFVTVTSGGEGEPDVLVNVVAPTEMVVTRDNRTGRVVEACQYIDVDDTNGDVRERAILFRPNETVWMYQDNRGWHVDRVDEHNLGRVPVAQLVNRPRASKAGGRSEITPAVRSLTDSAMRTLVGAEVAREFYAVPQRWMMGASEDMFLDENGDPRGAWEAVMGKFLAIPSNEDGDVPTVGSFAANSMSPFFEQLRELAKQVAAEGAVPNDYMGFSSDANPSSADAIRQNENRLVKRAERRQAMFGKAWTEVARLVLMVRDARSFDSLSDAELMIRPLWRNASTPTKAAAMDMLTKGVQIGFIPAQGDYAMTMMGLSPQDREMLRRDRAGDVQGVLARLESSLSEANPDADGLVVGDGSSPSVDASASAEQDAKTLKAKADAMGVMIRAGVKAESAARLAGIEGAEFLEGRPITLKYADEEK